MRDCRHGGDCDLVCDEDCDCQYDKDFDKDCDCGSGGVFMKVLMPL